MDTPKGKCGDCSKQSRLGAPPPGAILLCQNCYVRRYGKPGPYPGAAFVLYRPEVGRPVAVPEAQVSQQITDRIKMYKCTDCKDTKIYQRLGAPEACRSCAASDLVDGQRTMKRDFVVGPGPAPVHPCTDYMPADCEVVARVRSADLKPGIQGWNAGRTYLVVVFDITHVTTGAVKVGDRRVWVHDLRSTRTGVGAAVDFLLSVKVRPDPLGGISPHN